MNKKNTQLLYVINHYDPVDFEENDIAIELRDAREIIDGIETVLVEDELLSLVTLDGDTYDFDEVVFDISEDDYGMIITTDCAIWDLSLCDETGIPYVDRKNLFKNR